MPSLDDADPQNAFARMAEYLSRDGGKWKASNPNFDGSSSSPAEFGLWFTQLLEGKALRIEIVAHFSGKDVMSSTGQWVWHPGEGVLSYIVVDRGGGVTEGVTTFPDETMFRTIATRYGPNGSATHRDDNVLLNDDLHRNETFRDEGGEWVSGGVYEWRRVTGSGSDSI